MTLVMSGILFPSERKLLMKIFTVWLYTIWQKEA